MLSTLSDPSKIISPADNAEDSDESNIEPLFSIAAPDFTFMLPLSEAGAVKMLNNEGFDDNELCPLASTTEPPLLISAFPEAKLMSPPWFCALPLESLMFPPLPSLTRTILAALVNMCDEPLPPIVLPL